MWYYKNKIINDIDQFPNNCNGFIYKITNLKTGKFYIGRKTLYFERKRKVGKKYEKYKIESDWKKYKSSCKELKQEYNEMDFKKEIIHFAISKKNLTYLELKYQILFEVLEKDTYNNNILGKFYRKDVE
jgi:hypothetical protein